MTNCFLDSKRECAGDCMAFNRITNEDSGCVLLQTAQGFSTLFTSMTKPKSGTRHPRSAPTPKVNT